MTVKILLADKNGNIPDHQQPGLTLVQRLHNRLIKLVVGKRPVVMNVDIGPHLIGDGYSCEVDTVGGIFENITIREFKGHGITIKQNV